MKARETIARLGLLPRGSAVVAACSGGADSTVLLHLLCALRGELGLRVFAAHVNHGLRGAEADRDEAFVRARCKAWGVPLYVLHADVRAEAARTGESEELCGRRLRYAFLARVAALFGARIATAHTLTDSAETFFLNLARGTGLAGLCGIPPVRGRVVRPLIETTRAEVEDYCREHRLAYVNDSTNASRVYARNRARLDVLPAFAQLAAAPERALARAMRLLAQDEAALEALTDALLAQAAVPGGGWRGDVLCASPLCGRALCAAAQRATGRAPEETHVRAMDALLRTGAGAVALPGGWRAALRAGALVFERAAGPLPASGPLPAAGTLPTAAVIPAPLGPGEYTFGAERLRVRLLPPEMVKNFKIIGGRSFKNLLDCDKICGKAVIRTRRAGDFYHPAGRGVGKTLKKLFNEQGIPPAARPFVPVAADERGVIWVRGFGPDARCAPDARTVRAYHFSCPDERKGAAVD